jgi:nitronate monooxygenase
MEGAMIDRMQELLEAERAGVKCLTAMADQTPEGEKKDFLVFLRNDEGRFCAGLHRLIQERGGTPNDRVGPFADKVLAIEGEAERLALLIKGQAWVVRKIEEMPAKEMTPGETGFFADMHKAHVVNIEACRKYLPAGK